jgi:hypothetical protein
MKTFFTTPTTTHEIAEPADGNKQEDSIFSFFKTEEKMKKSRPPSDSVKRSSQSQRHIEADRINFSPRRPLIISRRQQQFS